MEILLVMTWQEIPIKPQRIVKMTFCKYFDQAALPIRPYSVPTGPITIVPPAIKPCLYNYKRSTGLIIASTSVTSKDQKQCDKHSLLSV